jgi:hypothetical protein
VRSTDESVVKTTVPVATVTQANTQAERMKSMRMVIWSVQIAPAGLSGRDGVVFSRQRENSA